ncbi:hypothetical protein [Streptomyces sp. 150FB]|uniref:DUF6197 family protein n=1 Tax=Streptomyces sp. 150FB TaxID=1576605 RepID=UPI000696F8EF|nr:hypothetical protein [Streptomyces sp. 150FB]
MEQERNSVESPEQGPSEMVVAVEAYLAEQAGWLEAAHERIHRVYPDGALWWGESGSRLTGEEIARHAEAAVRYLEAEGWAPRASAEERFAAYDAKHGHNFRVVLPPQDLFLALFRTARTDDVLYRLGTVLNSLLLVSTGAPSVRYQDWDTHPDRTLREVREVLVAAAAYARRYGPPAP